MSCERIPKYTVQNSKRTEDQKDIHEVCWEIPNFKLLLRTKPITCNIYPHTQTVVDVPDSDFKLKLQFGSDKKTVKVYYLSSSSSFINMQIKLQLSSNSVSFTDPLQIVELYKWQLCMSFILETGNVPNYESLKLLFTFIVHYNCFNIPITQISNDLGNLLTSGRYSDAVMQSVEGVEYRVHKSVITSRSDVLKAYFEHDMEENSTNIVKTAWNSEVLQDVLTYLYTDNVPQIDNNPTILLAAADYYELPGLKKLCEKAVIKNLTTVNIFETLELAELHSANYLKESTLEFIKDGRTKLIMESPGWADASAATIKSIYQYIMTDEKYFDYDILDAAWNDLYE